MTGSGSRYAEVFENLTAGNEDITLRVSQATGTQSSPGGVKGTTAVKNRSCRASRLPGSRGRLVTPDADGPSRRLRSKVAGGRRPGLGQNVTVSAANG